MFYTISAVCSFMDVLVYMAKTLSGQTPANTDTSLLWTVSFFPWGKKPHTFSLNLACLIQTLIRTLSMVLCLCIKGV